MTKRMSTILTILMAVVAGSVFLASSGFAITLEYGTFAMKYSDMTFADYDYMTMTGGQVGAHPGQTTPTGNVWGVFQLTTIHSLIDDNPENNVLGLSYYTNGQDGKYYFGVYGGLTQSTTPTAFSDFYLTETTDGAYLKIYELDASDAAAYVNDIVAGPNVAGGGAFGTFGQNIINATSATLWLDCEFSTDTLSFYAPTATPTDVELVDVNDSRTASTEAYIDIVGGSAAPLFDTGVFPLANSGASPYSADLKLISDLTSLLTTNNEWNNAWTTSSQDPITGNVVGPVPEPTTITLFGIGLLGLSCLLRRKED